MITKLKLSNFKSHQHSMLDLKPLTLISGVNNIGKSSVLQSLLLLRQSFKKGILEKGLDLGGPLVSIGVGNDALYKLANEPFLSIELTSENAKYSFVYHVDGESLVASFLPLYEESTIPIPSSPNNSSSSLADSLFGSNFQYLSASRLAGTSDFILDTYEVKNEKQISRELGKGELLGNFLYEFKGEPTFNYTTIGVDDMPIALLDQVIYWESLISNRLLINIQQKQDKTGFYITYGTKGLDGKKSIEGLRGENVGFGVSYSLSVVTALLSAKPGALIMIENPEAHLHPDGQSKLAELMCLVAQRGVQVIAETHSDHIINGVLVNCKRFENEGYGIDRENVSIYYFSGQDENHAVQYEEIKVQPNGQIDYQPKGFFDRVEIDRGYLIND